MALTAFLCSTDSSVGEDNKKDFKYLKMSKSNSIQSPPSPQNDSKKNKNNPFRRKPRGHQSDVQIIEHSKRSQQGKKSSTCKPKNGAGNKHSSTPQQSIAGSLANGLKQNGTRFLKSHHPFKKNLKNKKESKEEVPVEGYSSSLAITPCSLNPSSQSMLCQTSKLRYSVSCDSGNGDDLSSSCDSSVILDNNISSIPLQQQQLESITVQEEEPEEEVFEDALSNICSDEEYVTPLSSRTSSLTCLNSSDSVATPSDTSATPHTDITATPSNINATPTCTTVTIPVEGSPPPSATPTSPSDALPPTQTPIDLYSATFTYNESSNATPPIIHNDCVPSNNDTLTEEYDGDLTQDITLVEQDDGQTQNGVHEHEMNNEVSGNNQQQDNDDKESSPQPSPADPFDEIVITTPDNPQQPDVLPTTPIESLDSSRNPIVTRSLSYPATPNATPTTNSGRLYRRMSSSNDAASPVPIPCCNRHPLCYNWVLWYDKLTTGRPQFADYAAQLQNVSDISSVEAFWSVINNLLPPSQLPRNANYHFFKEGIKPLWEDSANKKGGKWVITFKTSTNIDTLLDKVWLEVLMALIGEQIEKSNLINGIVLSRRKKGDRIALWTVNNNKSTNLFICKQLLHVIGLVCDINDYGKFVSDLADDRGLFNMVYMLHKDSLKSGTSYQNEAHLTLKQHLQFLVGKN